MKRFFAFWLLLTLSFGCAQAEYWDMNETRIVPCEEKSPGCQVLQAVMMGSFAEFDPLDSLNTRVYSAALPRLIAVAPADFEHFSRHFGVDEQAVRGLYYTALCNCFRSDIIVNPIVDTMEEQHARTVLELFLAPADAEAEAQRRAIRENCGAAEAALLAKESGLPVEFIRFLLSGEAIANH